MDSQQLSADNDKLHEDFILRYSREEIDICCAYLEENKNIDAQVFENFICMYSIIRYLLTKKLISGKFAMDTFDKTLNERSRMIDEYEITNILDIQNPNKIMTDDRKNVKDAIDQEINDLLEIDIPKENKDVDFNSVIECVSMFKSTIYLFCKLNYLNTYEIVSVDTLRNELVVLIESKKKIIQNKSNETNERDEPMQCSQKCPLCNKWLLANEDIITYKGQIREFRGFLIHSECSSV